jgi:hypothetical protein
MFEQILYSHLQTFTTELSPHLAQFNNRMAIFNQEAPDDTSKGWQTDSQYGRIVYSVNLQYNSERIVSGTLTVDVICQSGKQIPEDMEQAVRPLIDGYFFTDTTHTIAAKWNTSSPFTDPTKKEEGVTILYTLLAFPSQLSQEPDPIKLLNNFTKELIPNSCVIGLDTIQEAWKPSNDIPAIYWRLVNINPCSWIPSNYACTWYTADCQAHIIAPDKQIETILSQTLVNGFSFKKSLQFPDGTYGRIDRDLRITPGADKLTQGQVASTVTYGILRKESSPSIENIYVNKG